MMHIRKSKEIAIFFFFTFMDTLVNAELKSTLD